jgi:hypothetical protein
MSLDPWRTLVKRHPLWRDALLWCLLALIVGAFLRVLVISYLPYALWGADSRSHYAFAQYLMEEHHLHMDEKRRFLYPLLMVPLSLLPGVPLRWLPVLQHALGLASLVPFAYVIRKTLVSWRWSIVPLTVFYSAFPVTILFEHQMVGECLLYNAFLWSWAGWQAWVTQANPERSQRYFWLFYVSFAALILTKPGARFAWPGLLLALAFLPAARGSLRRWRLAALAALALVTPFVGSRKHGALMLYTASFPLTKLDSPKNAPYKAEVRSMVEALQPHLDVYYLLDDAPFDFVYRGRVDDTRPTWQNLVKNTPKKRAPVCLSLAIEGILNRPLPFLAFGMQRLIASANLSCSDYRQFTGQYFRERERLYYEETQRLEGNGFRRAHDLPRHGPLPPYEEFATRLEPVPDSWQARIFQAVMSRVAQFDLVTLPGGPIEERQITKAWPTLWGWLALAGAVISFLPRYRVGIGVWTLVSFSFLYGVFAFSEVNYRHFAPAWPVVLILIVLPVDLLLARWREWRLRPAAKAYAI